MTELEELKEKLAAIMGECKERAKPELDMQAFAWDAYFCKMNKLPGNDAFENGEEYGMHMLAKSIIDIIEEEDHTSLAEAMKNSTEEEEDTTVASCSQSSGFS